MTFLPALKLYKLVNALYGCLSLLPFLHSAIGTSRFANHNTVGTALALPLLHATAASHLSSPFSPQILFILVVLVFFRMEILRSIGVACSGANAQRDEVWGMGRGLRKETLRSSDVAACRPCVLYFELEFDHKWSKATTGFHNSQALNAHTRDEHSLPTINHIHWIQTNTGQKTVLSQTQLPVWTIV